MSPYQPLEFVAKDGHSIAQIPTDGLVNPQLLLSKNRLFAEGELHQTLCVRIYDRLTLRLISNKPLLNAVPASWNTTATSPRMLTDELFCYFDGQHWIVANVDSLENKWTIDNQFGSDEIIPIAAPEGAPLVTVAWLSKQSKRDGSYYNVTLADCSDGKNQRTLKSQITSFRDVEPISFLDNSWKYLLVVKGDNKNILIVADAAKGAEESQINLGDLVFVSVVAPKRFLAISKTTKDAEIVEINKVAP